MKLQWYLNRLKKMGPAEIAKRLYEYLIIYGSQVKYRNPRKWPYARFASVNNSIFLRPMPGIPLVRRWEHYRIYNITVDLTKPIDWFFSEVDDRQWPGCHYARINYRPGNPYGDIRINWELNRLQFLPLMAMNNDRLACRILQDWLEKNPYLHGPSYLSSMEIALRWFSVYWASCLLQHLLDKSFRNTLTGFAVASGKFIENRLSTHSSAGNHLIIEAIGLFWLGSALPGSMLGKKWVALGRKILWEQLLRQISPDGTNKEQTFWYIGFVLDGINHYLLLEDRDVIPPMVIQRIEKMIDFVHTLTLSDGHFPDYGDRDDGFVFRTTEDYTRAPFPGLLNIGSEFFDRPDWYRTNKHAEDRTSFWIGKNAFSDLEFKNRFPKTYNTSPSVRTYSDGGMTVMQQEGGQLLFRHAPLGLEKTYGHGHADALSILFSFKDRPVLIDLGSGQYNGSREIRNYFRSTIAHNTVELGNKNQAEMQGPFMWEKTYRTGLEYVREKPLLEAKAWHDGYLEKFSIMHKRKVSMQPSNHFEIHDSFIGPGGISLRGAFHIGSSQKLTRDDNEIIVNFGEFLFRIIFPEEMSIEVYYGSEQPFIGWCSTVYGAWEPIYSVVFSCKLKQNHHYKVGFGILNN